MVAAAWELGTAGGEPVRPKILCAMPFLNELDLLELKCRELEGVVDLFAIIESPLTYTGLPKPLVFADNKSRFASWPFHHVIVDPPKVTPSAWEREAHQRDVIYQTIARLDPEIAIYCDTDECPRASAVERTKRYPFEKLPRTVQADVERWFEWFSPAPEDPSE